MGATLKHIERITTIKRRSLQYIFLKARSRGWNESSYPLVLNGYIVDGPRPSKKPKTTREFKQRILKKVTSN